MIHCIRNILLKGALPGVALLCCTCAVAQINLRVVYPVNHLSRMIVRWTAIAGSTEYQYRKKVDGGAYAAWQSVAANTTFNDDGLAAASTYTYQIRRKKADGTFADTSNERSNSFKKIWPVRKAGDCVTESVEILHGFGQPIQVGAKKYFHEGVDIHGESLVDKECVRAPMGGEIYSIGGAGNGINVNMLVHNGGDTAYIQYNHLQNLSAKLVAGETVQPGDTLGFILSGVTPSWNTIKNHTHNHYWKSLATAASFFSTTTNPFSMWDTDAYRDPQGKAPEIIDVNGDGESIRFRKTPERDDYFEKMIVHNGVDIVAEAIDKQSSDAPYQIPKVVGYSIQRKENGAFVDAVRTPADPYILMNTDIFYNSYSTNPNSIIVESIIDYRDTVRGKPPTVPALYSFNNGDATATWSQYFTYILTNTKGTDGKAANVDSMQFFATDARKTVAEPNGYKAGYDKARIIDEAKFPDGEYQVSIRLRDFVNAPPDHKKEFKVDNFRPYAKKVEIKSGNLNYKAEWKWTEGTGLLKLEDNKDTGKACGQIIITVTTSEAMKNVNLEVPSLFYAKINTTPVANSDGKVWEFTIPKEKLKDKPEGPHQVLITGKDLAENVMQGFLSKNDVPEAGIEKKKIDGTWTPGNPPVKDKVHLFKINSLYDKLTITTKDVSACNKNDGKATLKVTGVTGEIEYAVDGSGWKTPGEFDNLAAGEHEGKARIKGDTCETTKKFVIDDGSKITLTVSGYGTTEFCNNNNPPTVTLTASASGGSGKFVYSWPGGTLVVTGSGSYSVTVTDTVSGCKKTRSGEVIFVPIICSRDPNDIIGPDGYSPAKMVSKFQPQPYLIRFENDPDFATAPAQVVKINHTVDTTVNILSLRLGDFGFGRFNVQVPVNKTYYSARIDVKDSLGVVVDVTAGINVDKKEVFWIFESKDPATGLPPTNSLLGFLPVNDTTAKGEGYVMFTIKPAAFTNTGDTIHAEASIVFDINDPLATPKIFNTIDAVPPTSKMKATADIKDSIHITLHWQGSDDIGGSGVRDYDLYVSENGSPFVLYQKGIKDTSTAFAGALGKTYSFFALATDNTGNQEALKDAGEITVKLFGNVTLPVTWLYFKGMLQDKDVFLNWSTAREINSKWYIVERALDGRNFTAIGQLAANGNTTRTSNYHYVDADVLALNRKVLYYRLKQQNIDGTYSYSPVVTISLQPLQSEPIVTAYPNPFNQTITLQILNVTETGEKDNVQLFTVDGRPIYQRKLDRIRNNTVLLDDLPNLSSGTYLLKVIIKRSLYTIKMVKQ